MMIAEDARAWERYRCCSETRDCGEEQTWVKAARKLFVRGDPAKWQRREEALEFEVGWKNIYERPGPERVLNVKAFRVICAIFHLMIREAHQKLN
jgi:hypothetical protein